MKLLGGIADTSKDGLISFSEFQAFEGLLCTPDALYKTAFQLFDRKGNGTVAYGELDSVLLLPSRLTFMIEGWSPLAMPQVHGMYPNALTMVERLCDIKRHLL